MDNTTSIPGGGLGTGNSKLLAWGLGGRAQKKPLTRSIGMWKVDGFSLNDTVASLKLRERKVVAEIKLPKSEFDQATYPNMPAENIGRSIPIGFGVVKGANAVLTDSQTNRFKWLNHSVNTVQGFKNAGGDSFTPDTINLGNSEFTYTAWDGSEELYVDYTAGLDNPVDVAKALLIDDVRGAGIAESEIDISSTGKGFGTNGARKWYIKGTASATGVEVPIYPIGLHISEPTAITKLLDRIQAASFGFIFVDFNDKWQFKPWKPVPGDDLAVITENMIVGQMNPRVATIDAATKVIVKFGVNLRDDNFQREVSLSDRLRQLRGAPSHVILEKELPISGRDGARDWGQKSFATRGQPRRIFPFKGTSELKLAEPGDYFRLTYKQSIDEIVLITKAKRTPGETTVGIECIDNFGFRDEAGFYTDDTLTLPASLGGGSFTDWDDADTAAKKAWVKENWGIYLDDNGYADELDSQASFELNVYI